MVDVPNGNGAAYQRYSTIIQTVTVVALFVAGFWGAVVVPMQTDIRDSLHIREHEEFRDNVNRRLLDLETQFAELQKQQNSGYGLSDVIKNLQQELESLRLQIHGVPTVAPGTR